MQLLDINFLLLPIWIGSDLSKDIEVPKLCRSVRALDHGF